MKSARSSTRSAVALARKAMKVGTKALPQYSSHFSRKDYTQAQFFALLCLKQFLQQDYRGLMALVGEWSELRAALRFKAKIPHYSAVCYAAKRLGTRPLIDQLLGGVFAEAQALGLVPERSEIGVDATGFETNHASRYYVKRRGQRRHLREYWSKLTLACCTQTHLVAGALATLGPSQDSPQFKPVTYQAAKHLGSIDRLLADSGYDGEHNHVLARERLGIRSTVIKLNPRRAGRKWPKNRYRRQMKRRFHKLKYGQRWQCESVNSRIKRRLGSVLAGRSHASRCRESLFKVITHDLMILWLQRVSTEQNHLKNARLDQNTARLELAAGRRRNPQARTPALRSAAVPGCGFGHRPGACPSEWQETAIANKTGPVAASSAPMERERWEPVTTSKLAGFGIGFGVLLLLIFKSEPGFVFALDSANLVFHEAGHPFVGLFSSRLETYGGTLGQLAFPVILAVSFWRRREAVSFAAAVIWFFENWLNIARYMADARAQELPLVGGGDHDWANIFGRWRLLFHDTQIAVAVKWLGWAGMLAACLWVAWHWWSDRRRSVVAAAEGESLPLSL